MKPLPILLAGPTCCGKSSVANAVCAMLPNGGCRVISLDWYYRDLSHLRSDERAVHNFDHPDAIDWPLLKDHVFDLLAGKRVSAPTYDFANHVRRADPIEIPSAPVCIVEGILALYDDDLNAMPGLRVFVDVPDDVCLRRRVDRDGAERARSEDSVRAQFMATVQPTAEQFVRPTKSRADVVLDGTKPIAVLASSIVERIPGPYRR